MAVGLLDLPILTMDYQFAALVLANLSCEVNSIFFAFEVFDHF